MTGGGQKSDLPVGNPIAWFLRICFMVLGAAIALNLAVAFLRPVLPWILCGVAVVAGVWIAVVVVRWRRSRW
ncbi:hypothetical protein ACI2L1_22995 [Streptomyces sp. NPDC019531]|uniref:hypothetical protein n=1 Tax=Streptomyces sp. NPDC019531 TaxID=3365062 RepID=UPI00384F4B7B